MATESVPQRLIQLLETLPVEERQEMTAWLIDSAFRSPVLSAHDPLRFGALRRGVFPTGSGPQAARPTPEPRTSPLQATPLQAMPLADLTSRDLASQHHIPQDPGSQDPVAADPEGRDPAGPQESIQLSGAHFGGEGSQLVTFRLPTARHAELRTWCTDHGFTMASVVRGLIEHFLDGHRTDESGPHD